MCKLRLCKLRLGKQRLGKQRLGKQRLRATQQNWVSQGRARVSRASANNLDKHLLFQCKLHERQCLKIVFGNQRLLRRHQRPPPRYVQCQRRVRQSKRAAR